jgi:cytochrome P450
MRPDAGKAGEGAGVAVDTVPLARGAVPALGHALSLIRDPLGFVSGLPCQGDLVRILMGPVSVVVVCDAELTRQVLVDDRTFDKGGPLTNRAREVGGNGLVTCPYHEHRRQRRLCQPAFHPDRLAGYGSAMAASAQDVTCSWREGQIIDVAGEMMALTMRITVSALFGTQLPPEAERAVVEHTTTVVRGVFQRALSPSFVNRIPSPGNRRYHQARAGLRGIVDDIIAARRAARAPDDDLLGALMNATEDTGADAGVPGLTDAELSDEVITFLLAGTETTANALAWALHLLAGHPAVEKRLHAEVDHVLASAPVAFAHVPLLEETGRVLTETLRLYPPVWLSTRTVTAETELGGIPLPAGAVIAFSPYLIHHREDLYAQPDRFDPDRWRDRPPPRNAFLPFSGGARKCIGDRFALTEATLALAAITSRWKLLPLDDRPVQASPKATLSPRGLRMRVVPRTTTTHVADHY